ncbi:two-component sensor histidine kinase [Streptomyces sp. J2-1]|uniref:sensor histidine kinase n=1 Tax=Streptomyces corallincola TaxID=2851888 RepID=UPI001C3812CB|nr:histidine kinase [Streptomyces corallincola]MBV2357234.1 two-component sensor histidine kinase [Streptomyces corallincola]
MPRFLRPLSRASTYTRLIHLWLPMAAEAVWLFIDMSRPWLPALGLIPLGLIPVVRKAEGIQARLLLTPGVEEPGISRTRSTSWWDGLRTVVWLLLRFAVGWVTGYLTVWLLVITVELARCAWGHAPSGMPLLRGLPGQPALALLAPLSLLALYGALVGLGSLVTVCARLLLGPSRAERLAALEERTEQLLERTRIARELHDSIGHALTIAVVQAGAARAAGDPEFTDRALEAIEETGRAALNDLERVLGVLRESERPASARPTLADADRLLDSARASGAKIDAEVTGPVDALPGPVTREGYRIVQEALTNVLRHAGPVPIRLRIAVSPENLVLEVRNSLPTGSQVTTGRGSGLRGIRERAALLGGRAHAGPDQGDWEVRVDLPLG